MRFDSRRASLVVVLALLFQAGCAASSAYRKGKGEARKGYLANTLTPYVGDANTQTPEFKAFLVNVAKV